MARTIIYLFLIRHLFVFSLSVRATRTIICSSFVRLLFVFSLSARTARTVICSLFVYLPVRLAPARVAHTVFTKKSVWEIIANSQTLYLI